MQSEQKAQTEDQAPDASEETAGPEAEVQAENEAENQDQENSQATDAAETAADDAAAPPSAAEAGEGGVEAELAATKDKLLRALAEAENVRRRAQRDVENASKRAIAGFAREMVVVADNLSRALAAVDGDAGKGADAMKSLLEGVEMTAREMQNAFERNGITKLDPLGERFDPQLHEAMFEYDDPSKPAGTVGQVLEVGYSLQGQPLRPAKVGVTKGGPKEAPKGDAPTPSPQTLDEAAPEQTSAPGGNAYEDSGKPSGSNIDEEL